MLETQLAPREPEHGLQRLTPIRTFSNRDTQTGLNLQFQHNQGNMGGWEARRSDLDMCENRRAEQSATTKKCAQVSNYELYLVLPI